jgi:hypothetical protein
VRRYIRCFGVIHGGCEVEIWKRSQQEAKSEVARDSSDEHFLRAGLQPTQVLQNVSTAAWDHMNLQMVSEDGGTC